MKAKRTNRVKAADVKQGGYAAPPTGAHCERDGWMDGWMVCRHETLFSFHNHPHTSTYVKHFHPLEVTLVACHFTFLKENF
jgi:hypothetical protein